MNLIEAVSAALGEQTVTGTEAVELVIPRAAAQIRELKHQRAIVAEEVEIKHGTLYDEKPAQAA